MVSYTLEESSLRGSSRSSVPSIERRSSSRSSVPSMERRSSSTMERRSVTSESSEWVDIETGESTTGIADAQRKFYTCQMDLIKILLSSTAISFIMYRLAKRLIKILNNT